MSIRVDTTDTTSVDNAVDSWGYPVRFVDEFGILTPAVCKPGDGGGQRSTGKQCP